MIQSLLTSLIVALAVIYLARKAYLSIRLKEHKPGCSKCHPAEIPDKTNR